MKKSVFAYVIATLVCVVLSSCGAPKYPFKALSENIVEYLQSIQDNPELKDDESHFEAFYEKQEKLCKELKGGTIQVEVEKDLGFELVDQAEIGAVHGESSITIPVHIMLKVVDPEKAYKNENDLIVLVYNDKEAVSAVYLSNYNEDGGLEECDFVEVVDLDTVEVVNPYKAGDILKKTVSIYVNPFLAQQFVDVSRLKITKQDYDVKSAIQKRNDEIEEQQRQVFQ